MIIDRAPLGLLEVAPILSLCGKVSELLQLSQVAKHYFCLCLEGDDNGITEIVLVFEQFLCDVYEVFGQLFRGELTRLYSGLRFFLFSVFVL